MMRKESARHILHLLAWVLVGSLAGNVCGAAEDRPDPTLPEEDPAGEPIHFRRQILPILSDYCFQCHGPDANARKAKLRLDTREGAFASRDGGPVIVPGAKDKSELYRRITSSDPDEVMPPPDLSRTLSSEAVALIGRWIDEGARWGEHWAFEKVTRPPLPEWKGPGAPPVNPIDAYIQARLQKEGLSPSPEASREALLRRVSLDLTGLPPVPEEVERFLADRSPTAYERLVDRLLSSPAFGERMAWDWLDAARYADSNGYQGDADRTMWPWRDWVVEAFNSNLPFDQFTVWQLAGDLLPEPKLEQKLATGFLRNHMINGEGGRIPEENRVDYVMDMTETTGTVWLGLTLNCCRCHDHKYDPLSRRDYYSLFAFFNQTPVDGSGGDPQTKPNLELPTEEQRTARARLDSEFQVAAGKVEKMETEVFTEALSEAGGKADGEVGTGVNLSDEVRKILRIPVRNRNRNQLSEVEKSLEKSHPDYAAEVKKLREILEKRDRLERSIVRVMIMADMEKPRQTYMLDKGIYDRPGEPVQPQVPAKLPPLPEGAPVNRLGLARWIVSPDNPLTSRVIVNRLWQQFFGVGIVKTPEDFGVQGEPPVHPELLDWLAAELIESGWNIKHLCRLIVTSAAYRQDSRVTPEALEKDPENRFLARGPRFRMPSWMIRDQALAASGLLVSRTGGAPVKPYQPPGVWEEATFGNKTYRQDHGAKLYRRSLYTFWRRIIGPTMFFDTASRQVCTVKQPRTNSPLHALATLNDVTYVEAARVLAERILSDETIPADAEARIERLFRRVLVRGPAPAETRVLRSTLDRLRAEFDREPESARQLLQVGEAKRDERIDPVEHAAYTGVALAILNLDETLTKE